MPKTPIKAEIKNFTGGLVTEFTNLETPPNTSPDIENFELNRDGSIRRRLGLDYELGYALFDPPAAANNIEPPNPTLYRWTTAGGVSDLTLVVIQFDNSLMFFNLDVEMLSADGYVGQITLTDFPKDVRYGISSVNGKLVVVAGISSVAVVNYSSGSFTVTYDTIKTRDLWGIEGTDPEGVKYENDPLYRGSVQSAAHMYNLQNQSWGSPKSRDSDGVWAAPSDHYRINLGVYPSNSEQVWLGLQYKADGSGNPTERYYPSMSKDLFGTTALAAKGYFVIDAVNRGSSRVAAVAAHNARYSGSTIGYTCPSLPDYTDGGATVLAEFAGRMFYGGFTGATIGGDARSPVLTDHVFFSQLVKTTKDLFECYQEGDPTSRDDSDLLETDGGFIRIAGADKIMSMVPLGSALVVVCSNGVWAISGGSDFGFSATNYRVDKLSSFGCISSGSVIEEKGRVYFWGEEGIFVVGITQVGDLEVASITRGRIDTYYQAIPVASRSSVTGLHDSFSGKIKWLYYVADDGFYELILDSDLKAIYPYKIYVPNDEVEVVGFTLTSPFSQTASVEEVFSVADQVLSDTEEVVVDSSSVRSAVVSVKYLIKVGEKYTFGYYRNTSYRDFELYDGVGVDAAAHVVTGTTSANDTSIRKQIQFLTVNFRQTAYIGEGGSLENQTSCISRVQWDWANSADSLKWSATKQLYRNPKPQEVTNFDIVTTRNMVRGQGRAFSVYFETEPYKDCHIAGWSVAVDGNSRT